jgi:HEPN domain-containing protein
VGKLEQIRYWVRSAQSDWEVANELLASKRYSHALFFFHLTIEKLLKANWVKDNPGDIPPYTHSLEHLYSNTNLDLSSSLVDEMRALNAWNLEGRYPDYHEKISRMATTEYARSKFEFTEKLRQCLLDQLS